MDVPGAQCGGVEGIGTQDLAVGGDEKGVVKGEFVADFGDFGRLTEGEVVRSGEFCDRGAGGFASPTLPGIKLRDHQPDFVRRGDQTCQDSRREVWGACESYLQGVLSALGEQALAPLAHGGLA